MFFFCLKENKKDVILSNRKFPTEEHIMNLTIQDIEYLTKLAKIQFDPHEAESYLLDLAKIVQYVTKLSELDLENVFPTYHLLPLSNVFRDDTVKPSMLTEELFKNAPDVQEDCFHVPQVVEG